MTRPTFAYLPSSHLDLFWLGNYKTCLERGAEIIRQYVERCAEAPGETFLLDTVVFAEYFLERHPELADTFLQLVQEGRLEIGAVYVDRWETLILGESQIRNIQLGKTWCREVLGIDNPTVTHPDLPSMTPQIAQIYTQAGLRYYVTSRKVFPHGQVWRYRSPDGSQLLVLNYPRHYVFALLDESDDPQAAKRMWVKPLDVTASLAGFPLGTVLVSGSGGDLVDRNNFRQWFGRNLEDFVAMFRTKYPQYDFTYATAAQVLKPYEDYADLPCLSGEIPSVWGVAADEEVTFFQRDRELEHRLLTAETLVAVAEYLHLPWRPEGAGEWQGTFHEAAFFARKDPIQPGRELDELWRMHVFTQDHNGGGQEGALSTFQKRVIQQRALAYSQAILDQGLAAIGERLAGAGEQLLVFNPHGQPWAGVLPAALPAGMVAVDDGGVPLPMQRAIGEEEGAYVVLPAVPSVGYRAFHLAPKDAEAVPAPAAVHIRQEADALHLETPHLAVAIDRQTGNLVRIDDRRRAQAWGSAQAGRLSVLAETGNDVTLRMAADEAAVEQEPVAVEVVAVGALFATLRIRKRLLKCDVEQTVTVWVHEARLDLETTIYWWGAHNRQVRLVLPGAPERGAITYGAPFYGVGWTETAEGTAPRNSDEILPADQMSYREVQGWLHLAGERGGLTVLTTHPAFHHDAQTLSAVLLRTSPSCGDGRLFWENAGAQRFAFSFHFGGADWRAADVQRLAAHALRLPASRVVAAGSGDLPLAASYLQVQGASVALSSLYPGEEPGTTLVRLWETAGADQEVRITGLLSGGSGVAVDLLGAPVVPPLAGAAGDWRLSLPAWGIRTVHLGG